MQNYLFYFAQTPAPTGFGDGGSVILNIAHIDEMGKVVAGRRGSAIVGTGSRQAKWARGKSAKCCAAVFTPLFV